MSSERVVDGEEVAAVVGEPLRERLRSLDGREVAGVVAVAVLVVAGAVLWYVRSLPAPVPLSELSAGRPSAAAGPSGAAGLSPAADPSMAPTPTSPPRILVHVAGWVRRPGVYELRDGARVIDAIRLAGGPRRGADLAAINLAAVLADATQVVVPRRGHGPPVAGAAGGPTAGAGGVPTGGAGGGTAQGGLINLNTATAEELEALPGIGPTLAQRIIDHRTQYGPFQSVDDLLEVSGIGEQRLADIRSLVTV